MEHIVVTGFDLICLGIGVTFIRVIKRGEGVGRGIILEHLPTYKQKTTKNTSDNRMDREEENSGWRACYERSERG